MRKILYILITITCISGGSLFSQDYNVQIQKLSVNEGLSSSLINQFLEDSQGFIWMATKDGALRFDGQNFKLFLNERLGVHSNTCLRLIEDKEGNIWTFFANKKGGVGTEEGQYYYLINKNFEIIPIKEYFKDRLPVDPKSIIKIVSTVDQTLYFTTYERDLYKFDGEFHFINNLSEIERPAIHKCNEDGVLMIHSSHDLYRTDSQGNIVNKVTLIPEELRNPNYLKRTLPNFQERLFSHLYFKTDRDTLPRWLETKSLHSNFKKSPLLKLSFFEEKDTSFYLLTGFSSMALFKEDGSLIKDFSAIIEKEIGPVKIQQQIFLRKDQIWFNDENSIYIISFKENVFKVLSNLETSFSARGITESPPGYIHVGSNSVIRTENLNTGEHKTYTTRKRAGLWNVFREKDGTLIYGNMAPRIIVFDPKNESLRAIHLKETEIQNNRIAPLLVPFRDKENTLWIGTTSGLAIYNPSIDSIEWFSKYNQFSSLQNESINYFEETEEGIWLGTTNGLYLLDPEKGITNHFTPIPNTSIHHFFKEGNIFWLATYGDGLIKWNKTTGEIKEFGIQEGFLNKHLTAIYPGLNDDLWIATETGLALFKKETEEIRIFLEADGISHNEFNRASHFQTDDGKIYFGGLNGITCFNPLNPPGNPSYEVPFRITDYYRADKDQGTLVDKYTELLNTKKIELSADSRSFSIHFALLNYQNQDKNRYAYMIEGIHDDWIQQKENFIRIDHLPYGKFNLRIKAKDYVGDWNPQEFSIPILVKTPFYAQAKWQLLGFISLVILSLFFYKARTSYLKKERQRLSKIIKERTEVIAKQKAALEASNQSLEATNAMKDRLFAILGHDLKNPTLAFEKTVQSINYLAQKGDSDRILKLGNYIEKEAQQLYHLMDNLLNWALSQRKELKIINTSIPLKEVVEDSLNNFKTLSESANIQLNNQVPQGTIVNADRRILETIFRNLISNAFRYTNKEGIIKISAENTAGDKVLIEVMDNGVGINQKKLDSLFKISPKSDPENKTSRISIGLYLCKELIELMNGSIHVKSNEKTGTTFSIYLPKGV